MAACSYRQNHTSRCAAARTRMCVCTRESMRLFCSHVTAMTLDRRGYRSPFSSESSRGKQQVRAPSCFSFLPPLRARSNPGLLYLPFSPFYQPPSWPPSLCPWLFLSFVFFSSSFSISLTSSVTVRWELPYAFCNQVELLQLLNKGSHASANGCVRTRAHTHACTHSPTLILS